MIAGSELAIRGRVDKPIVSASLRSETPGLPLPPVAIARGGLAFHRARRSAQQPWLVEKSATLLGRTGRRERSAHGPRHAASSCKPWPIRRRRSRWETPGRSHLCHAAGRGADQVPGQGRPGRSRASSFATCGPGRATRRADRRSVSPGRRRPKPAGGMEDGDSRTIDYRWDLAQLAGLVPGDVLAVRITAEDYKPQLATSVVRRLTIITEEELESRIGQRQTAMLGQLAEALRIERAVPRATRRAADPPGRSRPARRERSQSPAKCPAQPAAGREAARRRSRGRRGAARGATGRAGGQSRRGAGGQPSG